MRPYDFRLETTLFRFALFKFVLLMWKVAHPSLRHPRENEGPTSINQNLDSRLRGNDQSEVYLSILLLSKKKLNLCIFAKLKCLPLRKRGHTLW